MLKFALAMIVGMLMGACVVLYQPDLEASPNRPTTPFTTEPTATATELLTEPTPLMAWTVTPSPEPTATELLTEPTPIMDRLVTCQAYTSDLAGIGQDTITFYRVNCDL